MLNASDDGSVPVPYTLRGYASTALCHELRGDAEAAARYVSILERARAEEIPRGDYEPTLARLYGHRKAYDLAFSVVAIETGGHSGCPDEVRASRLEVLGDLIVASQRWELADAALAEARAEAERVKSASLPAFADRLEGAAAFARGDAGRGEELLRSSIATFERLRAPWHAAWSGLCLGRYLVERGAAPADVLQRASDVFEELGSVEEAAEAGDLLRAVSSAAS